MIADDIRAKLLWAGLNLGQDDLPVTNAGHLYLIELIRAISLTWLFSGQRLDEIARLRLGCICWHHNGAGIIGVADRVMVRDAVWMLAISTHETGTASPSPSTRSLARSSAWQAAWPPQPPFDWPGRLA